MTVAKKPGHRGEREVSRKTIARGMPGVSRCDLTNACAVYHYPLHTRLSGASDARHSLRPLLSEGKGSSKTRAFSRRENAETCLCRC